MDIHYYIAGRRIGTQNSVEHTLTFPPHHVEDSNLLLTHQEWGYSGYKAGFCLQSSWRDRCIFEERKLRGARSR